MADQKRIEEIRELKDALRDELLSHPDVHSIGIGYRKRGGQRTDELCLIVTVQKKLPENALSAGRTIPKELHYFSKLRDRDIGVPVDVEESGIAEPYACGSCTSDLESRVRPVPGGYSISGAFTGTIGGWVWDNINDQIVLISNNHVLGGAVGTDVLQPGAGDGGVPADRIADVVRTGSLDATIAAPVNADDVKLEIECSTPAVYEIIEPALDMQVEKVGQTTSLTCGTITEIAIDRGHYGSTNDFRVDTDDPAIRFAYYGDSGSLIVERNNPSSEASWKRVVGLLWGGVPSEYNAFAHTISDVFADLDLTTVCSGLVSELLTSSMAASSSFAVKSKQRRRKLTKSFSRALEERIAKSSTGKQISRLMRSYRADLTNLIFSNDGRQAFEVALSSIFVGKVTTQEILAHTLTEQDILNFARLLKVMQENRPRMTPALALAERLLKRAEGNTIESLLKVSDD